MNGVGESVGEGVGAGVGEGVGACLSFFGLSRKIRCCNCPIQLRRSGSSLFAASEPTLDKAFGLIYWDQVRQNFQFQVRLISSR